MDYYSIETMPLQNRDFCFIRYAPPGTAMFTHRMAEGDAMGDKFPADASMRMDDKHPGMALPSLVANPLGFLVVVRSIKEILEATRVELECLPFTLLDHKKRPASRDYFIVNPLGSFDCLNPERSEIEYSQEVPGEIIGIDRAVLSARKLTSAPDFFRMARAPQTYVINSRVAAAIQKLQPTNFYVHQLEIAE